MSRNIVFINQATGYLTIDIINAFTRHFDKVGVIYGDLRVQDVKLNPKVQKSKVIEKSRRSNSKRLIKWLIATIQIFFMLITRYRKYEIFYFSVPPFAYFSSLLIKRKFSILMWDVYPDVLANLGISTKNPGYKTWSYFNRKLFGRAYRLFTIGDAPASKMAQYVLKEKIHIIPLWSGLRDLQPVEKNSNPFIIEHSLQNKFIVQYSGNMGLTHNIESLIEVAKQTVSDKEIIYLFIGRGQKWDIIADLIQKDHLDNCLMLPFQPDNAVKYSLSSADIGVVLVEDNVADVMIPSKVYNLFSVAVPILSISPEFSEIEKLISKYECGKNFTKNDFKGMSEFIRELKGSEELLKEYKLKSRTASKDFTSENALKFAEIYNS